MSDSALYEIALQDQFGDLKSLELWAGHAWLLATVPATPDQDFLEDLEFLQQDYEMRGFFVMLLPLNPGGDYSACHLPVFPAPTALFAALGSPQPQPYTLWLVDAAGHPAQQFAPGTSLTDSGLLAQLEELLPV